MTRPLMFNDDAGASDDAAGDLDGDLDGDLAAESDEPLTATDDAGSLDDEDDGATTGTCSAGPYHGRVISTRFPKGFLLVDRPTGRAWLYKVSGPGTFVCLATAIEVDDVARWRTAEGADFDVLAFDDELAVHP